MWDDHRLLNGIATFLYAVAALLIIYAAIMLVIRLPLFALREIIVSGHVQHTTGDQLDAIATHELRGNFFTVDLEAARRAFEKLPWVRKATVRRAWPDRLEVALEEHVALARWHQTCAGEHPRRGVRRGERRPPAAVRGSRWRRSPRWRAQYAAFHDVLAAIGRAPTEVRLSGRRAWQLKLDDGELLELGRQDVVQRLARFVSVYPRIAGQLTRKASRIDLRYPNGFAVRISSLRLRERESLEDARREQA